MRQLSEDIAANGKHWNDNTDAGQKQREMLLGLLNDAERVREAQIANGVSVQKANADYDAQVQVLLKLAGQAGATKAQLDALAKRYEIQFSIDAIAGAVSGVTSAVAKAFAGLQFGGPAPEKSSTFGGGRAAGGPVMAGVEYLVGENGPERFRPMVSGSIVPNGNQTVQVVMSIDPSGSADSLWAAVLKLLRDHVRFNGGSADVAFS